MIRNAFDRLNNYSVIPRVMISILIVLGTALSFGTFGFTTFVKARMTDSYLESVHTLFSSLEEGVKGSLERGQMRNFKKLLEQQKTVKGVIDVSLYDRDGTINLSSNDEATAPSLPASLLQEMNTAKTSVIRKRDNIVQIAAPQIAVADCIRCHPSWKEGEVGGCLLLTYDLSGLTKTIRSLQVYLVIGSIALLALVGCILFFVMRRIVSTPINAIIEDLSGSARDVMSTADKSAASSKSLAEHASQQAAALEETSASLEEISAMTAQNAEHATSANEVMQESIQVVTDANMTMEQLIDAMEEISQVSEETGKIIGTIDEIAFQTNLLALNAAVEAARAGEAGAGFAVVADEVRNLALRAADAAHNTTQQLERINAKVTNGVTLVRSTDESFKRAVEKTQNTAEFLTQITTASKEQSLGINQVSKAIHELDDVTQHNAANADRSSRVAGELEIQARQLTTYMQSLIDLVRGRNNAAG